MKTFAQKVAVITGAGSGMGRYLAILLARAGADVVICDVNPETLKETEKLLQQHNVRLPGNDFFYTSRLPDVAVQRNDSNPASTFASSQPLGRRHAFSTYSGCEPLRQTAMRTLPTQAADRRTTVCGLCEVRNKPASPHRPASTTSAQGSQARASLAASPDTVRLPPA